MTLIQTVESIIQDHTPAVSGQGDDNAEFDTGNLVRQLSTNARWGTEEFSIIDALSKRLDIRGDLYRACDQTNRPSGSSIKSDNHLAMLVFALLAKAVLLDIEKQGSRSICLKRINVAYKAAELVSSFTKETEALLNGLERIAADILSAKQPPGQDTHEQDTCESAYIQEDTKTHSFETLPITVLFYDGPIARAYLETLYQLGLKPEKIINLISARNISSGQRIGRWLPDSLRKKYAQHVHTSKMHYWSKHFALHKKSIVDAFRKSIHSDFNIAETSFDNANKQHDLSRYCDAVVPLLIEGYRDPVLYGHLSDLPPSQTVFLYTGGGIVPKNLLEIEKHRFIHVHPGYLPDIRGADCTLWSVLMNGHPSASCFYMDSGIDTGDIVMSARLPQIRIKVPDVEAIDTHTGYRLIYNFLDPWVRAFVLREVLLKHRAFNKLPSCVQNIQDGTTFHFAHEKIRKIAIDKILS